jgi:hypothetical protein
MSRWEVSNAYETLSSYLWTYGEQKPWGICRRAGDMIAFPGYLHLSCVVSAGEGNGEGLDAPRWER